MAANRTRHRGNGFVRFTMMLVPFAVYGCGNKTEFRSSVPVPSPSAEAEKNSGDAVRAAGAGDALGDGKVGTPIETKPGQPVMKSVEREFAAGRMATDAVEFRLDRSLNEMALTMATSYGDPLPQPLTLNQTLTRSEVSSNVTMTSEMQSFDQTFMQVNRLPIVNTYTQGTPGVPASVNFSQSNSKSGPIDILLVIDSSGSMSQEQVNLSSKLNPLLTSLANADWQISVVSTDPSQGCQRALIRKGDANAETAFASAVTGIGIAGSGNERGILMSVVGLKGSLTVPGGKDAAGNPKPPVTVASNASCPASAATWLRANAPAIVLIVSDEDNCSNGTGCGTDPWKNEQYLHDYLSSIRRPGVDARVYGLYWKPGTPRGTAANAAAQYDAIVNSTGGIYGDISAADYTATLSRISQDAATILKDQFSLPSLPDSGSAKVYVNGMQMQSGWSIAGTTLDFTSAPPAGASIRVDYIVGARPIFETMALSDAPAIDTIEVKENNQVVAANRWQYTSSGNKIVYRPADLSRVDVTYRKSTPALLKKFNISKNAVLSSIAVTVNGRATNAYTYDAASGDVTFNTATEDGAPVNIRWQTIAAKNLSYAYNIPANVSVKDLKATILATNAVIPVQFANNRVTFDLADHQDGRVVRVSYKSRVIGQETRVALPHQPLAGTLVVRAGGVLCPANQYTLMGTDISILCDPGIDDRIAVSFQYIDQSLIGKVAMGPILQYAMPIPANIDYTNLRAVDVATGTQIGVAYANGKVAFNAADHQEGREIKVSYLGRVSGGDSRIPLAHEPIPGTISVRAGAQLCSQDSFTVLERELAVSCDPGASDVIAATFNYVAERRTHFDLSEHKIPEAAVWQVAINGVTARPGTDYVREGAIVKLHKVVDLSAKIKIAVNYLEE